MPKIIFPCSGERTLSGFFKEGMVVSTVNGEKSLTLSSLYSVVAMYVAPRFDATIFDLQSQMSYGRVTYIFHNGVIIKFFLCVGLQYSDSH